MQRLFMAMVVAISGVNAAAAADEHLSEKQIARVRAEVAEYFSVGSPNSGNIRKLEEFRPYLPTLELLLKELRVRVETPGFSATEYGRATRYLRMVAEMAARLGNASRTPLRASVQREGRLLFKHYHRPSKAREQLMRIFDVLSLWGPEDAGLFLRMKDLPEVVDNVARIRGMLGMMTPDQLDTMAANFRAMDRQGKSSLILALLMETGRAQEKDLTNLLLAASAEFARSLLRSMPDQDEDFMIMRLESVTARLVSNKLDQVMWALQSGDLTVGSAFTKAVERVRTRRGPRDLYPQDRLLFFTLLQEGRLDWNDRASWRARAAEIARERISLKSRYTVEDNVILVNFGPKPPNCEDDLD